MNYSVNIMQIDFIIIHNVLIMRAIFQSLKQHIQPCEVYGRVDIENWTTAVDRHLHMLTEDGSLQKLTQG